MENIRYMSVIFEADDTEKEEVIIVNNVKQYISECCSLCKHNAHYHIDRECATCTLEGIKEIISLGKNF